MKNFHKRCSAFAELSEGTHYLSGYAETMVQFPEVKHDGIEWEAMSHHREAVIMIIDGRRFCFYTRFIDECNMIADVQEISPDCEYVDDKDVFEFPKYPIRIEYYECYEGGEDYYDGDDEQDSMYIIDDLNDQCIVHIKQWMSRWCNASLYMFIDDMEFNPMRERDNKQNEMDKDFRDMSFECRYYTALERLNQTERTVIADSCSARQLALQLLEMTDAYGDFSIEHRIFTDGSKVWLDLDGNGDCENGQTYSVDFKHGEGIPECDKMNLDIIADEAIYHDVPNGTVYDFEDMLDSKYGYEYKVYFHSAWKRASRRESKDID